MEEKDTRAGWGGKRPGAGRPKGTTKPNRKKRTNVSLSFADEDLAKMKELAEASGKTFSRFVADKILGRE